MQVTFTKTGEHSYAIAADRGGGPLMHMPRAPGFDSWLPHDVVHFLLERHFGIAGGVFGQIASGGDAGTFFTIPHRRRDPARRLSARLGELGREDTARSERLAAACLTAWHARRRDRDDAAGIPEALLDELDEFAERWHELPVGGSMTLTWPAELTMRPGGSAHGRRRDRAVAARRR